MRLTSKVTILRALRERYGLLPDTGVSFEPAAGGVLIRVAQAERVERMREAIAKTRGIARKGQATGEITQLTRGGD